jgi:ABC-type Na+ transport system ATPase subunit NatA
MAVKQIIGIVPEEIALYTRLTGRQNLRYFGEAVFLRLTGERLTEAL